MKKQQGFTLIEVLIAMAITAIVAVMAYSGLDSAVRLAETAEVETDRVQKISRVFDIMDKDFRQIIDRPVRAPDGNEMEAALIVDMSARPMLKFSRAGWINPQPERFQRSELQRINYHYDDGKLIRYSWQMMDRYDDSPTQEIVLLEDVKSFAIRVLSEKATINASGQVVAEDTGEWIAAWPVNSGLTQESNRLITLPVAIELTIELEGWGKIRRIYEVVAEPKI